MSEEKIKLVTKIALDEYGWVLNEGDAKEMIEIVEKANATIKGG